MKLRKVGQIKKSAPLMFAVISAVLILILLVAFAGLLVYPSYDQLVNGPKAAETLKDLETEFKMIAPLPGAVQVQYGSMHKTHQGDVGGEYRTEKGYEQIRSHYDNELGRHGWTFIKERPVTIWRRDYGGKEAFYCKGIYTATVQYAGAEPGIEWTYSFGLSWGLFDECK